MIHALPLAFSNNGAHFDDLRARAQDDGDHGDRLAYMFINEYVSIFILPPFFRTGIPLDIPVAAGNLVSGSFCLDCFFLNKPYCLKYDYDWIHFVKKSFCLEDFGVYFISCWC